MSQTSLPLSNILGVSVVVSPTGAAGPTFNQALIVGSSTAIPSIGGSSPRIRQYNSLTGMVQDGFSLTSPEYLAAQLYFGQTPAPSLLWVGRQDLTAIATVAIGGVAGTGYTAGDIVTVTQGGASGGQVKITTVNSGVPTALAIIPGSQGTGYANGTNLATTGGTGTGLEINITAIGETALQAITACRIAQTAWYACMFVGTAVDADHEAIAAYIEAAAPVSTYFLTTGEAAVLNGTPGNLLATLQAANYRRTLSVYSTTQGGAAPNNVYASAAVMGMAMGLNTRSAGSYFTLNNKTPIGVPAEPLTQSQVTAIGGSTNRSSTGLNGNLVLSYNNGSYTFLQPGVMSGGAFFDQVLNLDMIASDMQIAGVNLLASVPAVPITDAGVVMMKSVLAGALNRSQQIGFVAPAGIWQGVPVGTGSQAIETGDALPKGYYLYANPVSSLSQGQRQNRQLPPITALLIQAQAAQSLTVTINVQQ